MRINGSVQGQCWVRHAMWALAQVLTHPKQDSLLRQIRQSARQVVWKNTVVVNMAEGEGRSRICVKKTASNQCDQYQHLDLRLGTYLAFEAFAISRLELGLLRGMGMRLGAMWRARKWGQGMHYIGGLRTHNIN